MNNAERGYSFQIDSERLREFAKIPAAARLQWLEEANQFFNSITDPAIKKSWRLQRELGFISPACKHI